MSSEKYIIEQLRKSSSAEDFFALLNVDYDPKVLNVARLHILRRMGEYLFGDELSNLSEREAVERCKGFLENAYADFLKSSPIDERVFKVLKDAVKPAKPPNLVNLSVSE